MIKNNIGIIAEIANAHQGKVEEAISLYESAKSAGAKAIKFQIYTAEELLVRSHERFEHFKKQSFSVDEWDHIFNTVDRQGVEVYADVFGPKSFDYATTLSLDGIKIHSSDLGNHEMLSRIREFRGKVFISAGGSTAPELVNFVNPIIEADNAKEIILMHGFQTYPTPVNDSNLNKFNFFEELFGDRISYGYMDHLDAESELSYYIPYSLLFSGISYIEKHITHDRHLKGIDYFSSFEPQEFSTFLNVIQEIQSSFGRKDPFFSDSEITYRKQAKKVYVWSNDLKAGHVITESDVVMKRLDTEISSLSYGDLIGKKLIQNVSKEAQALKISLNSSVLAVIVVRTDSSRLPGKALKDIAGEESIVHLLKRLEISKGRGLINKMIVCTSISPSDDKLASLISSHGYEVYRGQEENVLNRMMLGINDNPEYDIVLRVTGDDILIDPDYLEKTIENFKLNNSDYTDAKNLPSGTEVEVFSRKVLEFIHDNAIDTSGSEYLTNYFKDVEDHFVSSSLDVEHDFSKIRLTLDTKEDYQVISNLIMYLEKKGKKYDYNLYDINQFFNKNPEEVVINSEVEQRAIPDRFNTKIDWKKYSSDPLITVYITCFNYADYVEKAIDSVLNQNLSDFELIIIDDGSTDDSRQKISRYKSHPKVKILFQENLGLNKTNNVAISLAKGKFIMRLDADDFLDKNALHLMSKKLLEDDDLALVFPDYFLVDSKGEVFGQEKRHDFEDVEMMDQPAHGACTMFRKSILEKVGNYSEEYDCQDGYEIWTKIAENHKVSNINLPLFYYRQHPTSLSRNEEKILSTRSKILSSSSKISDKCNILVIIPIRDDGLNLALEPFHTSNLLNLVIEKLKDSNRIKDILISSNNKEVQEFCLSNGHNFHVRSEILSEWNSPIEDTIDNILDSYDDINSIDYLSIINYEYPFMDIRNIENSIDIIDIYNANSSMSVISSESNYFNHDGSGLVPLSNNKMLRLERDKLYEETGGIHSVNFEWYRQNRKLHSEKVSHLIIDKKASRKVNSLEDLKMFEYIFGDE